MTWTGLAIAVHVIAVVWWIGGVAFATLVFIPALRADPSWNPRAALQKIEGRFAPQARIAAILVGLSGGYLLWALGAWQWLSLPAFWWLDLMIAYWVLFVVMLFVIEPLGLMETLVFRRFPPDVAWRIFHAVHAILLAIGVVIIGAAAAGSHGL